MCVHDGSHWYCPYVETTECRARYSAMEPLFNLKSKRSIKDTLIVLYGLIEGMSIQQVSRECTLGKFTIVELFQFFEYIVSTAHDMRFDASQGTVLFMQKDETCVSRIKRMGCGRGKRVRRDGSSWYHTLVHCDEIPDEEGRIHYPMKEIFVKYLESTDAATMTAHVCHLAKNSRCQIYTDCAGASKCLNREWRHGAVNHRKHWVFEDLYFFEDLCYTIEEVAVQI